MDGLRDELFARPEDERMVADEAHIPTEDGAPVETDAKRAWKDRQSQLRQVQEGRWLRLSAALVARQSFEIGYHRANLIDSPHHLIL